ncbi:hypothetical protein Gohar_011503 [Gossypium harknessii]|uniref:Tobamovirus multiplication protein 2B n=3 Tax=Gossypium TaxID=3633 RepID=A0A7J8TBZ9_GOSDV|nr:hypothetical protein [Gossypium davidsonii]MBA0651444.1 hypothetical protein [Gossypium klotzschianum]MBA0801120.1 hypothetical protein [Gossypium harknessii]
MATAGRGGRTVTGTNSREGTAKSTVNEQISQAVLSTSNLLHLMQQSSPSRTQLMKLPKILLAKTPTIKNTGQMLELMPRAISSLDAHIDNGLQRLKSCASRLYHQLLSVLAWHVVFGIIQ